MTRMAHRWGSGIAGLCLLLVAVPAVSAQGSAQGTITLRATVTATCALTLSTGNATLDLNAGITSIPVATVEERCNAANGYTVSLTSKNGGALSSGSATIAYTLQYGDSSSSNGSLAASRDVTGAGRQTVLSVSVPAGTQRQAGQYEDTVTIAIAAK